MSAILEDEQLLQRLKDEKFDLAVTELFSYVPLGIFEVFPSYLVSNRFRFLAYERRLWHPPWAPSLPSMISPAFLEHPLLFQASSAGYCYNECSGFITTYSEEMSFLQRLDACLLNFLEYTFNQLDLYQQNRLIRRHYPTVPDLYELLHVGSLFFVENSSF